MDLPGAATNGSHHQKLPAWEAGDGGSIAVGQEHGRAASSQCKIAAAHGAQMGEFRRRIFFYFVSIVTLLLSGRAIPRPREKQKER